MSWEFRRCLKGQPAPETMEVTLGATLTKGTPVAAGSSSAVGTGKVVALQIGAHNKLLGVLISGGVDTEKAQMIPALPDVVFEAPIGATSDTPDQFGTYDIESGYLVDDDTVTNPKVQVIGPGKDGLYSTTVEVIGVGWGSALTD